MASPLFTHGQADIVHSGAGSVSEYMLTIPQNFTGDLSDFGSSAAQVGSTLGRGTAYNQFDGFASFSLRGLASDATLTLLNGRRLPAVGMVEAPTVSVIPSALIKRIDIIPDGASATYGADAVAGVVNIVTRDAPDGVEVRLRGSATTQTGAGNWEASVLGGQSWDSGEVYGMAMYQSRSPFVDEPIMVSGHELQITQLPGEDLGGLYAGFKQRFGHFTIWSDASTFQRDRDARQIYVDEPRSNRHFKAMTSGYSVYNGARWQGEGATSIDLNLDYHRNRSKSQAFTGPRLASARRYTNTLFVADLTGQTALFTLPAGPVLAAGGAQFRSEKLWTDATIFFNRNGATRKVKSVFGELNVPVIGPEQNLPLMRALTLSAAARYEDIGADEALAPKIGLRWQIDRSLALRGTYARSFLVPRFRDTIGIAEQVSFWDNRYGFLNPADQNPALAAGNAVVLYRAGANPDLRTQDADTFTVGFDYAPSFAPGLMVKANYYRIKISGRVGVPSQDDAAMLKDMQVFNVAKPSLEQVRQVVNNPAVFRRFSSNLPFVAGGELVLYDNAAAVPLDILSQVQVIADIRAQNFGVESTDGFDFDLAYDRPLFDGQASFKITGQYILNLDLKAPGGEAISRLDGYAQPSDLRLNGTALWGRDGFSVGAVVNYVDGFTDNRAGRTPRKLGSFTTTALFVGFDLGVRSNKPWLADSELQIVVANAFTQRPPTVVDGVLGFDPFNNPPSPRTVSVVLTKRFGGA
ncbi:TonB-dependent receptor [Caulobacter sp. 73W]|uniref:TonB-dependent receptor n=1 Tax=Caulobacter sp. 73W TaxID=3161137 RepID=A0AB39KSF9_9CAUL